MKFIVNNRIYILHRVVFSICGVVHLIKVNSERPNIADIENTIDVQGYSFYASSLAIYGSLVSNL